MFALGALDVVSVTWFNVGLVVMRKRTGTKCFVQWICVGEMRKYSAYVLVGPAEALP